jgi:hypothetical protein
MKKIILSLIVLASVFNSVAQDEKETFISPKHFIGLHAGSTTGYGISYRYWPTKFGGEITSSPRFERDGLYTVSTGLSFLYKLKENKRYTIYSYVGNSLLATKQNEYTSIFNQVTGTYFTISTIEKREEYNASIGFGYKVNFWQNLDFNLQAGYGFYDLTNDLYTNFTGEISMYYHF